jgi:hypothetical protein
MGSLFLYIDNKVLSVTLGRCFVGGCPKGECEECRTVIRLCGIRRDRGVMTELVIAGGRRASEVAARVAFKTVEYLFMVSVDMWVIVNEVSRVLPSRWMWRGLWGMGW